MQNPLLEFLSQVPFSVEELDPIGEPMVESAPAQPQDPNPPGAKAEMMSAPASKPPTSTPQTSESQAANPLDEAQSSSIGSEEAMRLQKQRQFLDLRYAAYPLSTQHLEEMMDERPVFPLASRAPLRC